MPTWYKAANDGPLLINARSETIAEKPAFKAAVRARRCLIPVGGFYEWTKTPDGARDPWYITRHDGGLLAMAGIWQVWTDPIGQAVKTCAMVTTSANKPMSAIHHRMPVVLEADAWGLWLGEQGHGAATLMQAAPDDRLQWHRVDRAVNSNRASGAELIQPL